MTAESGLTRVGGVVIVTGAALKEARDSALIAVKHRKLSGLPYRTYEALACEFAEAMAAAGHSDVRLPPMSDPVPVEPPTVALDQAATRLGHSERQTRRLAPQLGSQKIAGRWFFDEMALREHLEGR